MSININDIENLYIADAGIEYWNDICTNIEHNFNQILKNELLHKHLKQPIEVNFYLNQNIEHDPNAYVEKVSINKYNIYIGRKLLLLVNHYSYKIHDYGLIYSHLEKSEKNNTIFSKISSSIFYYWMDFICLHEWFHITRGHLEYKNKPYYEFNILENHNSEDIYFEMDADIYAMKFLTFRFALTINEIKIHIQEEDKVIIKNFIFSMIYLFDLFFLLNKKDASKSHPKALERINIILPSIAEAMHRKNLLSISVEELVAIINESVIEFILHHGNEYKINTKEFMVKMPKLIDNYFDFFKTNNMKPYQFFKESVGL